VLSTYDADLVGRDTAIPGLGVLLDPDAFLAALRSRLPDSGLSAAHPAYIRYKPGMNCLVGYALEIDGVKVAAYAKGHRADARDQLDKAREQASVASPLGPGRIVLDKHSITVSIFPNDSELKTLARLGNESAWQALLRRIFSNRPDLWEGTIRSIRYKPERRYVTQLVTEDGPAAVLKLYTETGYQEAKANVRAFKSRDLLNVPRRVGHSDRHNILAFEWMQGRLLSEALSDRSLDLAAVRRVGVALAEGHSQPVAKLAPLTREAEASTLLSVAAGLSFLCPHLAGRIQGLARKLAGMLMQEPPLYSPIHGDFYAKQVLLDGDSVVILDFDAASAGDPAADLGLFTAHLERGALRRNVPSDRVAPLSHALLEGYASATRHSPYERVGLYTAAGLLKLAPHPFRNLQRDWPQGIEATIARAEAIMERVESSFVKRSFNLAQTREHALPQLERATLSSVPVIDPFNVAADPTMPFMAQALNPLDVHMQFRRRLSRLAGPTGQLSILDIRVVRHKPGRRCLVEYDVAIEKPGAPAELITLVGKARARGLDKSTYQTVSALWQAGFRDDSADGISSVPEPVGVVPEFQMWLHRKVEGSPATRLLPEPGGEALAGRIASALHKLHNAGVRPERRHTMRDELRILHERLPIVAQGEPGWAQRIERLLNACDRIGASLPRSARTGIHRDFYADQVIVDGDRLYLLDFDLYCEGDPALDAGNFLGHMREQSIRSLGDPHALRHQEEAFEERFIELHGEGVRHAIKVYTALTLVRHVHLSTLFPERRRSTQALLEMAEEECAHLLNTRVATRPTRLAVAAQPG
jgi:aminoglycoside phosphotransferase (APT) family kinase protein